MLTIPMEALTAAARVLIDADAAVDQAEAALKVAKERARVLREETLPSAMLELGLTRIDLSNGDALKLVQEVYASIPKDTQEVAFTWLTRHKFDAIIKMDVSIEFGKGQKKQAMALYAKLAKQKFDVAYSQGVHNTTLKAFLKEQMATGTDIPLELFGAWPVFTTKLIHKKS